MARVQRAKLLVLITIKPGSEATETVPAGPPTYETSFVIRHTNNVRVADTRKFEDVFMDSAVEQAANAAVEMLLAPPPAKATRVPRPHPLSSKAVKQAKKKIAKPKKSAAKKTAKKEVK
jgi:hypothetical protein